MEKTTAKKAKEIYKYILCVDLEVGVTFSTLSIFKTFQLTSSISESDVVDIFIFESRNC